MIQAALTAKLDFIAITDHKFCPEVLSGCAGETRIKCFPGKEITIGQTHVLAIGITKNIGYNTSLTDIVKEIHRQGGIAIAAHPNVERFYYLDSELTGSGFDAQECTGDYKERRPLPCIYNSDAHKTGDLAWQLNSCNIKVESIVELKENILTKKCFRSIRFIISPKININ